MYRLLGIMLMFLMILFSSHVQGSPGFRYDPLLVEEVVNPGETLTYTIQVENQNPYRPLTLRVEIMDIMENVQGAYELLKPMTTPYSLADWVTLKPEKLVISPGDREEVEVSVAVPRGVQGGAYGAVVLTVIPNTRSSEDAMAGSHFYFQGASFLELVVAGSGLRQEAYPEFFSVEKSREHPGLSMQVGNEALVFSLGLTNEGNVHLQAQGTLILQSREGRTLARFPMGGGRGIIIPGATVALRTVLQRQIPPGEYLARAVVDYGGLRPVVAETLFTIEEAEIKQESGDEQVFSRFTITPQDIEMELQKGGFSSVVLELENHGQDTVELLGTIIPLAFDERGALLPEAERGEAPTWIQINPSLFSLQPQEKRRVRLLVQPPRGVQGGYYADILFRSQGDGVSTETGANLLLFVGPEPRKVGSLNILKIQEVDEFFHIDVLFSNESEVHLEPEMQIHLDRLHPQEEKEDGMIVAARREEITSISIPHEGNPVLPHTDRLFTFMIPGPMQPGDYELNVRVDYDGEEPRVVHHEFSLGGIGYE